MNTATNHLEAPLPDAALYAAYAEGRADEAEARRESIARAVVRQIEPRGIAQFTQEPHDDAVHSAISELLDEEQRNKHRPPVVRSRFGERRATVSPYDFAMDCVFEYTEGEPLVMWGDYPHPGSPSYCELRACHVGGVDIYEMLNDHQIERIEELLLEGVEA